MNNAVDSSSAAQMDTALSQRHDTILLRNLVLRTKYGTKVERVGGVADKVVRIMKVVLWDQAICGE
jgi:hypothetical protein